jgi:tetratricopeptide (TPR) repeat protein
MKKFNILTFVLALIFFAVPTFAQKVIDYNTLISDCLSSVKNQQFTKAIELCTDAIKEKSDSGMAYYLRAFSYSKTHRNTSVKSPTGETVELTNELRKKFAVSDAEKCTQLISNEYPCFSLLGSLLYDSDKKDESEKAIKNLSEGIRLGDKNIELYRYRAVANQSIALSMQPTSPEAKQRAEQALNDYDTHFQGSKSIVDYEWKAQIYEFLGKYDLAIADYTKVIQENDDDELLFLSRGKIYLKTKNYQLAIDDFTKALEIADDGDDSADFEDFQKEILPLRMQAYKALKNKTSFCEDLKILDAKLNCDKEWKKK